ALKNSEIQLYAVHNMALLEWENRAWESGAELWEATASLAQRIGAHDVEISAIAGVGLCRAEEGKFGLAREAHAEIEERLQRRPDWFTGREVAEALIARLLLADGRVEDALQHLDTWLPKAEAADIYSAIWLTAVCAPSLIGRAPDRIRPWIERYRSHVDNLGYADISKQLNSLLAG